VQSTRDEIFALFGASVVGLLHDPQRVLSMRRCDVGEALRENVERPGAQGRPPRKRTYWASRKSAISTIYEKAWCHGRASNPDSGQAQAMTIQSQESQIAPRFFTIVDCMG